MVILNHWKRLFAGWTLTVVSIPVAADGILEQMQNEVASIAGRTRIAVVTVEDERAIFSDNDFRLFFGPDNDIATPAGARRMAEERVKTIDLNLQGLDKKIESLTQQFARGIVTVEPLDDLNRQKAHLSMERASLQQLLTQNLANFASLEAMQSLAEELAQLTRKQTEAQENVTKLKQNFADAHPKVRAALEMARAYQKRATDIQQKLKASEDADTRPTLWATASLPRSGTGFCIGDGYIVTTADVVEGMVKPVIVTDGGARIKANVVGVHSDMNIGLLQIQAKTQLPALKFGDSSSLSVGHFAISVGNQSGQANSVALMLVGGLRTEGTYSGSRFYPRLIQIAGTVGAGTSGAPLVNARGEAVGVMVAVPTNVNFVQTARRSLTLSSPSASSAKVGREKPGVAVTQNRQSRVEAQKKSPNEKSQNGQTYTFRFSPSPSGNAPQIPALPAFPFFEGQGNAPAPPRAPQVFTAQLPVTSAGYAIPINDLKPVIEQLRMGKVTRGWIGIAPADIERIVEEDGVLHIERTVKVEGVFPDSPASRAKLLPGDILIELDGKPVQSAADIREASLRVRPGDTLELALRRDGDNKRATLRITLKIEPRPARIETPVTEIVKEEPKESKEPHAP